MSAVDKQKVFDAVVNLVDTAKEFYKKTKKANVNSLTGNNKNKGTDAESDNAAENLLDEVTETAKKMYYKYMNIEDFIETLVYISKSATTKEFDYYTRNVQSKTDKDPSIREPEAKTTAIYTLKKYAIAAARDRINELESHKQSLIQKLKTENTYYKYMKDKNMKDKNMNVEDETINEPINEIINNIEGTPSPQDWSADNGNENGNTLAGFFPNDEYGGGRNKTKSRRKTKKSKKKNKRKSRRRRR
jgi:hypothetical protein